MRQIFLSILLLVAADALAQTSVITTVAGTGTAGTGGDGGAATAAQLNGPYNVAVDSAGNYYIADWYSGRIRKVNINTGVITTVAGTGSPGNGGDGGPATAAPLQGPEDVAVDAAGNLYIADSLNNTVRKVSASNGVIEIVAGNGVPTYNGEGPATSASLNDPVGVAVDSSGNLYIADQGNHRIRKVTPAGIISTFAGTGVGGFSGDGGPATSAQIYNPVHLTIDSNGNLYLADYFNHRIRKISLSSGVITTVAGSGPAGADFPGSFAGDGGPATTARLNRPAGVAVDPAGNIYIADTLNKRIRKVTASTGVITTVAGGGSNGEGCAAVTSSLSFPLGVAVNSSGNRIYIADFGANVVQLIAAVDTPAPVLTSINPASGTAGTVRVVTLTGTGLSTGGSGDCQSGVTTIAVSGSGVTSSNVAVNSGTSVTVTLTIAPNAVPGPRNVTLTTETGTSNAIQFSVVAAVIPTPTLTSISPASGLRGTTVTVTLAGTNFATGAGATTVAVSGTGVTASNLNVSGATALTATFNIAAGAALGSYTVAVSTAGGASNATTFAVNPPVPVITYGLPQTLNPTQQAAIQLSMPTASPDPIAGQLAFTFTPNASNTADDPNVTVFSGPTSARNLTFTFPANATTAQLSLPSAVLQAGTVAGTIRLTMSGVQVGGQNVVPASSTFDVTIPRLVPTINSVRFLNRTTGGFDVEVTGYSTSKDITQATFQFTAASGANLQTAQLQPAVNPAFVTYYQSAASAAIGSSFVYVQPFTAQQGDANVVISVTVTLANAQGTSAAKTAP